MGEESVVGGDEEVVVVVIEGALDWGLVEERSLKN